MLHSRLKRQGFWFPCLLALTVLGPFWEAGLRAQSAGDSLQFSSSVQALIEKVSRANIEMHIRALSEANGHFSRVTFTEGNRWTVQYLKDAFAGFPGLSTVALDTFQLASATTPYNEEFLFNVVATLQGQEPDSVYVICGHLDCSGSRDSGIDWQNDWANVKTPGADDNASGLAAMLEIARVLSDPESGFVPRYTLQFVAFGAEEFHPVYSGHHLGSFHFASRAYQKKKTILGVYNIDMIGYNSTGHDYVAVVANSPSEILGRWLLQANTLYELALETNRPRFPEATYSDHESFWRYRYRAILLIENAPPWNDNLPFYTVNPHYHTRSDSLANINLAQVEKVAKAVLGAVASLSGPTTGVRAAGNNAPVPAAFAVLRNYPNPFNGGTLLAYKLASAGRIRLSIFNMAGQEVAVVAQGDRQAGWHRVFWQPGISGRGLASGIYMAILALGNKRVATKLILSK